MRIGLGPFAILLAASAACGGGGGPAPSPAASSEQLAVALETTHFRILAGSAAPAVVRAVADALEANHARITGDLRTTSVPIVDVWIWHDSASFYGDMQRKLGRVFQGSGGWVPNAHAVSVLEGSNTPRGAVHEFAHVVSLAVNPSIGNNPRWLWETVALYENGQFVKPDTLEYMRAGRFPTLADLNADYDVAHQVYDVGFVLGEFIVSTWGLDGLVALVRANGRLDEALAISSVEFETRWYAWLRARYLPAS